MAELWLAGRYHDAFNPTARELFYNFSRDAMFSAGVDALWLDATGPLGHALLRCCGGGCCGWWLLRRLLLRRRLLRWRLLRWRLVAVAAAAGGCCGGC